ncbi:MAG: CTP synthase, partial [bacterium]|nr:CTP synthase [bacterium]
PHVTNEIKSRISSLVSDDVDVVITEIGGTVGDIEILPYLEAIRQVRLDVGRGNVCYIHVTLVPFIGPTGEQKTKPTQHSVTELRSRGVQPDAIVCRSESPISDELKRKVSSLCDVDVSAVVNAADADSIYEIPLVLHEEGLDHVVCDILRLDTPEPDLSDWRWLNQRLEMARRTVRIGLIGKYVTLPDAYLSVVEALNHAAIHHGASVEIEWVQAESVEGLMIESLLSGLDGIVIPGGFGERGVEGKINAASHARENGIPCLGLCLGLQVMAIDYARNVLGLAGAHSSEFDPRTPWPVIDLMESQRYVTDKGGTMRLGACMAKLRAGTKVAEVYGAEVVSERHRHRYEFNPKLRGRFEGADFVVAGESPDGLLVEFIELDGHPWWVGTQSHPEFKSRPDRPAPLFCGLLKAALDRRERASGAGPGGVGDEASEPTEAGAEVSTTAGR